MSNRNNIIDLFWRKTLLFPPIRATGLDLEKTGFGLDIKTLGLEIKTHGFGLVRLLDYINTNSC